MDVHDPWVDPAEAKEEYGINLVNEPQKGAYDAVIVAVGHEQFKALGVEGIRAYGKENAVLYDVKYVLDAEDVDDRI